MKSIRSCDGIGKNKRLAENMTLREVMEFTRDLSLTQGGLSILLERIIQEIEKLQSKNEMVH
jgi:hypothetical protein